MIFSLQLCWMVCLSECYHMNSMDHFGIVQFSKETLSILILKCLVGLWGSAVLHKRRSQFWCELEVEASNCMAVKEFCHKWNTHSKDEKRFLRMKHTNGRNFYDKKDKRREWEKTVLFRARNDFLKNEGAAHYWNSWMNRCVNESSDNVYFI